MATCRGGEPRSRSKAEVNGVKTEMGCGAGYAGGADNVSTNRLQSPARWVCNQGQGGHVQTDVSRFRIAWTQSRLLAGTRIDPRRPIRLLDGPPFLFRRELLPIGSFYSPGVLSIRWKFMTSLWVVLLDYYVPGKIRPDVLKKGRHYENTS